jgi:hypothetical protein
MKLKHLSILTFLIALLPAGNASAASVSYGLNLNNIGLSTGIDYATVTIKDDAEAGVGAGLIQFEVDANNDFFDEGSNFGIQSFYFNSSLDFASLSPMISAVPAAAGWSFNYDFSGGYNVSEFGLFNIQYAGTGNSRRDPLVFTLGFDTPGTAVWDIMTFALDNADGYAFAAHIADFSNLCPATSSLVASSCVDSGWFSGSVAPNAVPVPAAFWLFGSALIGFIGMSRRTGV